MTGMYLVVTTMSAIDVSAVKNFLHDWGNIGGLKIVLLLEEDEVSVRGEELKRIVGSSVELATYHANKREKRSPMLEDIWEVFRQRASYDGYIYVNGDILLSHPGSNRGILSGADLERVLARRKVTFAKRRDFKDSSDVPVIYQYGYDMVIVPTELLGVVPSFVLKNWQIGQVGWDYALPLGICKRYCITSTELGIYHRIHRSASQADWSRAMLNLARSLHWSWVTDLGLGKRLMLRLLISPLIINTLTFRSSSAVEHIQRKVRHFYSRIIFYGFIYGLLEDLDDIE